MAELDCLKGLPPLPGVVMHGCVASLSQSVQHVENFARCDAFHLQTAKRVSETFVFRPFKPDPIRDQKCQTLCELPNLDQGGVCILREVAFCKNAPLPRGRDRTLQDGRNWLSASMHFRYNRYKMVRRSFAEPYKPHREGFALGL
jgi:hypothetical protein